ncbi:MAG: hypothetical protein LAN84_11650 [Acidobacteriia bacterium]|nr:hypothetical protein [Terriglobia bacterium]
MIERFNFYDVYGYFLPGFGLLGLIWLPFGLFKHSWPSKEVGSALIAVVLAYIVGHFIQTLATQALPSRTKDSFGNSRYPSDFFLDPENPTFSKQFKEQLASIVRSSFGIDLMVEKAPARKNDPEFAAVTRRRQDAFLLSRGVLIREKIAAYPEQFEGMYTLMRGLATASFFGFAYFVGWTSAISQAECLTKLAIGFLTLALACIVIFAFLPIRFTVSPAMRAWLEKTSLAAFLLAFLCSGHLCGLGFVNSGSEAALLAGLAAVSLILFLRFFTAYKSFAQEFAKAVWRDYVGHSRVAVRLNDTVE